METAGSIKNVYLKMTANINDKMTFRIFFDIRYALQIKKGLDVE